MSTSAGGAAVRVASLVVVLAAAACARAPSPAAAPRAPSLADSERFPDPSDPPPPRRPAECTFPARRRSVRGRSSTARSATTGPAGSGVPRSGRRVAAAPDRDRIRSERDERILRGDAGRAPDLPPRRRVHASAARGASRRAHARERCGRAADERCERREHRDRCERFAGGRQGARRCRRSEGVRALGVPCDEGGRDGRVRDGEARAGVQLRRRGLHVRAGQVLRRGGAAAARRGAEAAVGVPAASGQRPARRVPCEPAERQVQRAGEDVSVLRLLRLHLSVPGRHVAAGRRLLPAVTA